jgi:cation:H+ antiporter
MFIYFLFVLGFVFLIKGADFLVDGASSLAKRLRVSSLVIGLTIVAFGTSMPELIVNLVASFRGNTELAIGNVIGSNIANILLILGAAAVINPLKVSRNTVWKEIPLSLLAVVVFVLLTNDFLIDGVNTASLTRSEGLVLLCFFLIFLVYIFNVAKSSHENLTETIVHERSVWQSLLLLVAGLVGLVVGGRWIVDGAVALAKNVGLSESFIGLTIVALGTSLPELATSVVAAYRNHTDIAIGNVVGSNIFNIFFILGVSAAVRPLPFTSRTNTDISVLFLTTVLFFIFLFLGSRHVLERWQGAIFLVIYLGYIILLVFRG